MCLLARLALPEMPFYARLVCWTDLSAGSDPLPPPQVTFHDGSDLSAVAAAFCAEHGISDPSKAAADIEAQVVGSW